MDRFFSVGLIFRLKSVTSVVLTFRFCSHAVDEEAELDMGPFCKIQSNPIQQLNDPIQSNP